MVFYRINLKPHSMTLILSSPAADPQNDIQSENFSLDWVGIDHVRLPLCLAGWENGSDPVIYDCEAELSVSLAAGPRGIHMSRLLEVMNDQSDPIRLADLSALLESHRQRQDCGNVFLSLAFYHYVQRNAPVTGLPARQAIRTVWKAMVKNDAIETGYELYIPVTTLCPCSRDISDYGAHSQRGWIQVTLSWVQGEEPVAPAAVYEALAGQGSAPIYPLLKRADERLVTMQAYDRPSFIEDLTRNTARVLKTLNGVKRFSLLCRNEESIHTHDAIARLRYPAQARFFDL